MWAIFGLSRGKGKSLICYQNMVTPSSNIAVLLRSRAIEQMKETTKSVGSSRREGESHQSCGAKEADCHVARRAQATTFASVDKILSVFAVPAAAWWLSKQ